MHDINYFISIFLQLTSLELGEFRKDGKGFHYVLKVKENREFYYRYVSLVDSKCKGKWELKDNTLFLKCDSPTDWAMTTTGYIS